MTPKNTPCIEWRMNVFRYTLMLEKNEIFLKKLNFYGFIIFKKIQQNHSIYGILMYWLQKIFQNEKIMHRMGN
jgi:hypothetical protein